MATFDLIDSDIISIGETSTQNAGDISPFITQMSVSLTMDASSEIQFTVIDKDFGFGANNYFQLRRNVYYRDLMFEISRVEVSQDQSSYPVYTIAARSKNIQLMKRDKDPEAFSGLSPTEFASTIAARFNMEFFGQETNEAKNIVKGSSSRVDESVWDVLNRVAGENQFTVFETQNILFFTSQEHLLGKWGDPSYVYGDNQFIPIQWPSPPESKFPGASSRYRLIGMPSVSKSDDDWKLGEGSFEIERVNGVKLRPGMTISLLGIPDFEALYLITAVEFDEGVPDPVRVQFRSPDDPDPPQSGSGVGGNSSPSDYNNNLGLPDSIKNKISDYVKKYYSPSAPPPSAANVSRAEYQMKETKNVIDYTLRQADSIWQTATTEQQVDEMIAAVVSNSTNKGYKYIPGRALGHVRADLKAKQGLIRGLSLPSKLKTDMRNYYIQLLGVSIVGVDSSLNKIYETALAVYNLNNTSAKNKAMDKALADYGSSSIEYRVLTYFRSRIIPSSLAVFDGQYFPSTPI
jgi:hypothetical protein